MYIFIMDSQLWERTKTIYTWINFSISGHTPTLPHTKNCTFHTMPLKKEAKLINYKRDEWWLQENTREYSGVLAMIHFLIWILVKWVRPLHRKIHQVLHLKIRFVYFWLHISHINIFLKKYLIFTSQRIYCYLTLFNNFRL